MKRVIFFATIQEAESTLQRLNATWEGDNPLRFRWDQGYIFCTGIGLRNALAAAMRAPKDHIEWVNIGVAGSLNGSGCIGGVFNIDMVGLLHPDKVGNLRFYLNDEKKTALFSSRLPVYTTISTGFDCSLVDMEGYAIAHVARRYHVPIRIVKTVSDLCSIDSHTTILQNLPRLSRQMADILSQDFC